jgi:hypothetical protein
MRDSIRIKDEWLIEASEIYINIKEKIIILRNIDFRILNSKKNLHH